MLIFNKLKAIFFRSGFCRNVYLCGVLISFCSLPFQLLAQSQPEACELGLRNLAMGNYLQALSACNKCIEQGDTVAESYFNRGKVYDAMGQYNKAFTDYKEAIRLAPEIMQPYYAFCEYYIKEDNFDKAIFWANKAIENNPESSQFYNFRGWIYFSFEKYHTAFKDFSSAIELDPKNAMAHNNRGSARYKMQDIAKAHRNDLLLAKKDYERAMALDTTLPNVFRNLGYVHILLENYDLALYFFDKAEHSNPKDAMVNYYKGLVLDRQELVEQAIIQYDNALEKYENFSEAHFAKGLILLSKDDLVAAENSFKAAQRVGSGFVGKSYYQLAVISAKRKNNELMLEYLKYALKEGHFDKPEHRLAFNREASFQPYRANSDFKLLIEKIRH